MPCLALSRVIAATANGVDGHNDGHLDLPATSALVLLVECDLASLLICANELLDEGYEVIESESAVTAMAMLLLRRDFDVMIVDIDVDHAPEGLALVRYATRHLPAMKILIHSAWIDVQNEPDVIVAGLLPKPYPPGALVRQMLALLTPPTR
ncbi:hypothetical protein GCM10007874_19760 [Labrys miyagiensis]|uniref:Response regulatory domain-containing protein n=1 Tax=Labrys miyagiensis TaxID=346912 RepID=A0ABQ6CJR2_9HYPH|nr:hypothetical protein GCM10007874_19760 [Labrys miyagiensis]